jgi:hypothetical protein
MEEPDGHLLATGYALNAGHRYGLLSPADVQAAVAEARRRHPAPPALTFIEARAPIPTPARPFQEAPSPFQSFIPTPVRHR